MIANVSVAFGHAAVAALRPPLSSFSRRCFSLEALRHRGVLAELLPRRSDVHFEKLLRSSAPGSVGAYCGVDPTANSLHVGHLASLSMLLRLRQAGLNIIALVGGATALVGDPAGHHDDRAEIAVEGVAHNAVALRDSLQQLLLNHQEMCGDGGSAWGSALVLDNAEWYKERRVVDWVRNVAGGLRLHDMLNKDSVRMRQGEDSAGMSLREFLYPLFQGNDWLELLRQHNCRVQVGGNDQQGNIDSGQCLVQRLTGERVFGLTVPLLMGANGRKLGKSSLDHEKGSCLWLKATRTSPFELYQRLLNTADADTARLLRLLTFVEADELEALDRSLARAPEKRLAQRRLAEQVTQLAHGQRGLTVAELCTRVFFPAASASSRTAADGDALAALQQLTAPELEQVMAGANTLRLAFAADRTLLQLVMATKHCHGVLEAENLLRNGVVRLNQTPVRDPQQIILSANHVLPNGTTLLRVGKKNYTLVIWDSS